MYKEQSQRLHGLDHLRALAILLVLLFHYQVYYGIPEFFGSAELTIIGDFGWSGVDLFFVLSGYLIGNKLLADIDQTGSVHFSRFYANRALRLLPAYFATVAIYFLFAELQEGRAIQPLWKFLTFTQNIPIDLYAKTFSHAWSLCVAAHFYVILPLLLYFLFANKLQRNGAYVLLGVIVFGAVARYITWEIFVDTLSGQQRLGAALQYLYYPTYTRLDGLTVGVAIAALFRYQPDLRDRLNRCSNLLLIAGLSVLIGCYHLFDGLILSDDFSTLPTTLFGFPLISIGYGLLVVSAISPSSILYRFRLRATASLATLSYATYLVHKMTNHWINTRSAHYFGWSEAETFFICLAAAILGGMLLHLTIEKPFLRLRNRFSE